ncbi:putative metabolite transport protein YjhB [Bolinopsis microptera]|uniref:putative metabolite transport protein YjhB n=1 Tax=Bolinopsis microptera TaxID=2820187 RepID=UPI00307A5C4B
MDRFNVMIVHTQTRRSFQIIMKNGENDVLVDKDDQQQTTWTRNDKMLLICCILCEFADGTEMDLPGMLTQQVSCDIGLSHWKEGLLDYILFFSLAVSVMIAGPLAKGFGKRKTVLISLYLSVCSLVMLGIIANYTALLLARALLGFCCGIRYNSLYVWAADIAYNKEILDRILFITHIIFIAWSMWSSVLGFLLLDWIGWRKCLLFSTLPVLILPIIMVHFCVKDTRGPQIEGSEDEAEQPETVIVSNFAARTTKMGLLIACITFNSWLTTLLVPALIQLLKINESGPNIHCSVTMTQGPELLLLALVNFAGMPSAFLMHWMKDKIGFRKLQGFVSLVYVANFILMLTQQNLVVAILTNFITKFLNGIIGLGYTFVLYDVNYFGTSNFEVGTSIATTIGLIGGIAGSGMVSFASTSSVIITAVVVSVVQVMVVFSMTEVQ